MSTMRKTRTDKGGESWWFWCGGCKTHHRYVTKLGAGETGPTWTFSGTEESPTFEPSLLANGSLCQCKNAACEKDHINPACGVHRCHLFLRAGQVQYLADCTHALAGQTVPVEPPCFGD